MPEIHKFNEGNIDFSSLSDDSFVIIDDNERYELVIAERWAEKNKMNIHIKEVGGRTLFYFTKKNLPNNEKIKSSLKKLFNRNNGALTFAYIKSRSNICKYEKEDIEMSLYELSDDGYISIVESEDKRTGESLTKYVKIS